MRIAWLLLVLSVGAFLGAQELVTDRPDQTESAEVILPGSVQVELGATHTQITSNVDNQAFAEFLVRIGVFKNVELRVGYDGYNKLNADFGPFDVDESGSGDSSLGFKWKMAEEKGSRPQTALLVATSLPTGDDAFTADNPEPSFRFNFSHTLSETTGLAYNLGMAAVTENDENGEHTLAVAQYTLTYGVGVSDRVGLFLEAFGDIPTTASGGPSNYIDGGLTVAINPKMQWDLAGGTGISDNTEDWFITTGLSFRIDR